ncbi:Sugar-transfer associated ATP-grasp [Pseudobutyrivibrio sp. 49]|uniref:sugar-transfer associated ATP-grasp domain-containing protein n=1 Tax=Pseudobutyrivibrio sp. 49 TaxID=1855344 RepID=UPI000885E0DD|nr:sugar-transfer associated ATP-grasp domain-containing protein [Pseudobutyrivibrio sp. 49]SDI71683.1 Sugar-transfer associated ATP-grasp [Pseudobutyrivibrio sp. 49]
MKLRKIRNRYKRYQAWKWNVWKAKSEAKLPFPTRVQYALRGFSPDEYRWFELDKNDYKDYISEHERLKAREINGGYKFILDDKLVFEEIVGQYANVPKNYAWVNNGFVYGLHGDGINKENLIEYLQKYKKTVLKWTNRGGGGGTYVITFENGEFDVNGEKITPEEVSKLFDREGSAILCEYITQSEFAASLYPYTTNTIRLVCARKKGEEKARFICAIQRCGCKKSIPVDNVSKGGFTISVDAETGELGAGYTIHGGEGIEGISFNYHPDTNEVFTGKRIPNWKNIVNEVVELTNKLPYLNFVAWDILLTDEGFYIIEGNASSGCRIFQMEHGVKNELLGQVLSSYGIF